MRKLATVSILLFSCLFCLSQVDLDKAIKTALLNTDVLKKVEQKARIQAPLPSQFVGKEDNVSRSVREIWSHFTILATDWYEIKSINYQIVGGDLYPINKDAITTSVEPTSFKMFTPNCSSGPLNLSPTYEISWQNSQNVRLSNTLQSNESRTYTIAAEYSTGGGPVGPSGRISTSESTTFGFSTTNAQENGKGTQENKTWRIPASYSVPAHKVNLVKIDFNLKHVKVPIFAEFKVVGTVVVQKRETQIWDRDLTLFKREEFVLAENQYKLSDLLQDSLLTFKLEGYYEATQASQLDLVLSAYDQDISNDETTCKLLSDELKKSIDDYNRKNGGSGKVIISKMPTGPEMMKISRPIGSNRFLPSKSSKKASPATSSQKIIAEVKKILDEQVHKVTQTTFKPCPDCNGNGKCYYCHGAGSFSCGTCYGSRVVPSRCTLCGGSGVFEGGTCTTCSGTGSISVTCPSCNGLGTNECQICHGSTVCRRCNGTGAIPD